MNGVVEMCIRDRVSTVLVMGVSGVVAQLVIRRDEKGEMDQ